jgi:hypothetical protein
VAAGRTPSPITAEVSSPLCAVKQQVLNCAAAAPEHDHRRS